MLVHLPHFTEDLGPTHKKMGLNGLKNLAPTQEKNDLNSHNLGWEPEVLALTLPKIGFKKL